jgi:trehalose/maltose hydrolase-like predicted phosphorylase
VKDGELVYDGFDPAHQGHREALCTLGNGYMATRGAFAEAFADGVHYPGTYVAGIYNRLASDVGGRSFEQESIVNLPNWLPLSFRPEGGAWATPASTKLLEHRQELDLLGGVLRRRSRLVDPEGRVTVFSERRLVSMASPHVAALEQVITPENWSGALEVRSGLDGRVTNANLAEDRLLANVHLSRLSEGAESETTWLEVETTQSRVRVAAAARVRLRSANGESLAAERRRIVREHGSVAEEAAVEAEVGRSLTVEKVAAIWTSRDRAASDPLSAALADVADAPGFDRLLADHRRAWEHLWERCRFDLGGDQADVALLVRVHAFHVLQTLSPHVADLDVGVPARGLHGEGYRGHVFWDELFVFPLLNLRIPELARALLLYRARRLPAARRAARAMGLAGARFPWQSGADGSELTPTQLWNPRSLRWMADNSHRQHHVSLAVAWNVWQYYQATADARFLAERGIEILVEIARFWAGLATPEPRDGRFDIRGVMGPDEYHDGYPDRPGEGIDNNAYTNVLASWVLQRAVEARRLPCEGPDHHLWERLGVTDAEVESWDLVGRHLRIPFHDGIVSQFEGWERLAELDWEGYRRRYGNIGRLDLILESEGDSTNRYKLAKQADVLMLFYLFSAGELTALFEHLGYDFDPKTIPATVDHYISRTAHGSTLSHLVHAWVVARTDRAGSWEALRESLVADLDDTQGGTTAEGIHLGAMAGGLDVLQRCYTGLEVRGDALRLDPRLPEGLPSLGVDLTYRGHVLSLSIGHDTLDVRAQPCAAAPVQLLVAGRRITLAAGEVVSVPLGENRVEGREKT